MELFLTLVMAFSLVHGGEAPDLQKRASDPSGNVSAPGMPSTSSATSGLPTLGQILSNYATSLTGNPAEDRKNTLRAAGQTARNFAAVLAGPMLAQWIMESRDASRGSRTRGIPQRVRVALGSAYPAYVYDRVRYRIGERDEWNIAKLAIGYGAHAVTLFDTIIFADQEGAQSLELWAHELKHVQQYKEWGVQGFARRYIYNYVSVEEEAYAAGERFADAE